MASSFRRNKAVEGNGGSSSSSLLGLKGTKPWTGGITLTSSGIAALDNLLGGGMPLGTCLYLQEDRWTDSLGRALLKYWCSECLSQKQHLVIPVDGENDDGNLELETPTLGSSPERSTSLASSSAAASPLHSSDQCTEQAMLPSMAVVNELLRSLPKNLQLEKEQKQEKQDASTASSSTTVSSSAQPLAALNTLQEEEEDDDDEPDHEQDDGELDAEAGLNIAWQYRKDVQHERLGQPTTTSRRSQRTDTVYCHSYDLSGKLSDQLPSDQFARCESIPYQSSPGTTSRRHHGMLLFLQVWHKIQTLLSTPPRRVIRLLFYHADAKVLSVALPLLLAKLRQEQLPVVLMVVLQAAPLAASVPMDLVLRRSCDVVLETECFATRLVYPPPPEFRDFQGLLKIRKISTVTGATAHGGGHFCDMTTTKRPAAMLYGLKRDRRKLHIKLLHIPPEDYAEGGTSVGGSGVRSGAGRKEASAGGGCAASGGASPLDF